MSKHFLYEYEGRRYAVLLENVSEIVEVETCHSLPGNSPICQGAFLHRNLLVPVLNSTFIGIGQAGDISSTQQVVVIRVGEVAFGLTMERFTTVIPMDEMSSADGDTRPQHYPPYVESLRGYQNAPVILLCINLLAKFVSELVPEQKMVAAESEDGEEQNQELLLETPTLLVLCANLHGTRLALPLEDVLEVIEGYDVTRLFRVTPSLRGLINLRGSVLACVDISAYLNVEPRVLEENNQFVVLQYEGADLALCVDSVERIRSVPKNIIQEIVDVSVGKIAPLLSGIAELEEGPLFLLSVKDMFNSPELLPYLREEA